MIRANIIFCATLLLSGTVSYAQKEIEVGQQSMHIIVLDILNSPFRETNPCLTPDGKYLFFMSGRGGNPWNNPDYTLFKGVTEPDGDIYYSKKIDGKWSEPVNLGPSVNTDMGEDEPNVTPDGQFVVYQSWKEGWEKDGGPYYISELSGADWGKPTGLGGGIHQFFKDQIEKNDWIYATDGSSLSPDGNIFVFASAKYYDQPMDIFISRKQDSEWDYPQKLPVSTKYGDERSVYIAGDNQTMYFSSSGYKGHGKLDIYKTIIFEDNRCGNIINLGPEFNSPEDDFGFTMTALGNEVFFTRNGDIIFAELKNPDKSLRPLPTLIISGLVNDYYGNPVESNISIIKNNNKKVLASAKSNKMTGEYSLVIQKAKGKYIKRITAENYRPEMIEFEVTDEVETEKITEHILLKKANSEMVFFELDQSTISPGEYSKLDSIVNYMFNNKSKRMVISGHADQSGTDQHNLELSEKRAVAVKKYMMEKGVPEFVIRTQYFGESDPIKKLPYEGELYINRRVEIEIVERK